MSQDRQSYVRAVLNLYTQLPGIACRVRRSDRDLAGCFFERQVSIDIVKAALLLGTARRMGRHRVLAEIRSLHYFEPIVEELLAQPPPPAYIEYLRQKILSAPLDVPVSLNRQT